MAYAVDMMYADNMNDKLYGLMVARSADGNLKAHHSYRIIITKGNYDQDVIDPLGAGALLLDCTQRRLQVIEINPYGSENINLFWRPLGLSYYQNFDVDS